MKTRFDYSGVWITGVGEAVPVGNMETPHLLNTVRMLVQKPARTLSILVADIEHATFSDTVWTPFNADDRKQSLKNVTSLSDAELVEYVQSTPLFKSMIEELQERGVNTKNVLSLYSSSEAFQRYRHYYPSAYDCTGQAFTSWYKVFVRGGRFWAYHRVSVDV